MIWTAVDGDGDRDGGGSGDGGNANNKQQERLKTVKTAATVRKAADDRNRQ
jgi:hypothetical protein